MSGLLLTGARLPWPTNWEIIFGRSAPLWLEIGCGGGQFLVDLAQKRPDVNLLGLEISLPSLYRAEKKLQQSGIENVRLVRGDAQFVLWALCEPASIDAIYINFPDPWPKEKHLHRRLISDRFLHLAATRMLTGASLELATDHADYALAISEQLLQTPYFDSQIDNPFLTYDEARLGTKYEAKALVEGRICHYFKWQRNSVVAPNPFPIPREVPMPHMILHSPLSLKEISRRFVPQRITNEAVSIKLLEVFYSLSDGKLLVEAYVAEEPLSQRVGLMVRPREGGEIIIGLHEIGFPRPTPAIHAAIYHLAGWIMSLHPEIRLVNSNLLLPEMQRK